MQQKEQTIYVNVILPIKFREDIWYTANKSLTDEVMDDKSIIGRRILVTFANKKYIGVIKEFLNHNTFKERFLNKSEKSIKYKEIDDVTFLSTIKERQIKFWEAIAKYYMCTIGEVYKAAYPINLLRQESIKNKAKTENAKAKNTTSKNATIAITENNQSDFKLPDLSSAQQKAYSEIKSILANKNVNNLNNNSNKINKSNNSDKNNSKPILLNGVTGSGKTEIYITLATEYLNKGESVLYMVPEIAISKQLNNRLKEHFGEKLYIFHSKQTIAEKEKIHKIVSSDCNPVIVLGTRSALFLPYNSLGLIIVDEEHDMSYKQKEPAPRYNGRDSAIILSKIFNSDILLGSATPSYESIYNCLTGRFAKVLLNEKFYGAQSPEIELIDTLKAYKMHQMNGNFSQKLINEIRKCINNNGQVLVFRNRRSYSPIIQCSECGDIPKCPHCNVYLSYHKYNNTLRCHYCDFTTKFNGKCSSCGSTSMVYKGSGTEKIEEELSAQFPEAKIARFDADIAKSKREEERIIKEFAKGNIDILVGTQMISKGFDFNNLKLVAVLQADTILGIQDFRADERAIQLFNQLVGRTGRRTERGKLIIQTSQKDHPVFKLLEQPDFSYNLMEERKEFLFTPYVRMIKLTLKHTDLNKLDILCTNVSSALLSINNNSVFKELSGPFIPTIDKVRGEWHKCFYIKLNRDKNLIKNKSTIFSCLENLKIQNNLIIDVDPV